VCGTIISTDGFSRGTIQAAFEPDAAPITLIDGEKMLDLLIENEIEVKSREVKYFEFDQTRLAQPETSAVCGLSGSENPGLIWLTDAESREYEEGQSVFGFNNASMKVRAE
jgi:hypothetical protein